MNQPTAYSSVPKPHVENHLWASVLAMLLCCNPLAIVAIIYSIKTNNFVTRGNLEKARAASKLAKIWLNITLISGILWIHLYGLTLQINEKGIITCIGSCIFWLAIILKNINWD
jgi:uncharacterized membrane protein YiaA